MRSAPTRGAEMLAALALCLVLAVPAAFAHDPKYTRSFRIEDCTFSDTGSNPYFILQPGYQLVLEGTEDGALLQLTITVLTDTLLVDGVLTRVVEERETTDGELVEVSRNYFAICAPTNTVFYFGEDVDIYENGVIVSHDGAWRAGVDGARPGVMMPGINLVGTRYFQEIAPGVAMDRAETRSLSKTVTTPLQTFTDVLKVLETTPLEPGAESHKYYAPGVGLIKDGKLKLVSFGFIP